MLLNKLSPACALLICAALVAVPSWAADEGQSIKVPLDTSLRFLIRPTLMGLVPPADSEGYGEAFIRVLEANADSLSVRYEIKEHVAGEQNGSSGATRIRRGDIDVQGFRAGNGITPPLFWPDGNWETGDGLLWLPLAAFARLQESGECAWNIGFNGNADSEAVSQLAAHIGRLRDEARLDDDEVIQLEARGGQASYPCWINGERSELPALQAVDGIGLAEYWILDDPDNPLVLKMNFIPPAIEDGEAAQGLGLIETGAGYAVTEIDF